MKLRIRPIHRKASQLNNRSCSLANKSHLSWSDDSSFREENGVAQPFHTDNESNELVSEPNRKGNTLRDREERMIVEAVQALQRRRRDRMIRSSKGPAQVVVAVGRTDSNNKDTVSRRGRSPPKPEDAGSKVPSRQRMVQKQRLSNQRDSQEEFLSSRKNTSVLRNSKLCSSSFSKGVQNDDEPQVSNKPSGSRVTFAETSTTFEVERFLDDDDDDDDNDTNDDTNDDKTDSAASSSLQGSYSSLIRAVQSVTAPDHSYTNVEKDDRHQTTQTSSTKPGQIRRYLRPAAIARAEKSESGSSNNMSALINETTAQLLRLDEESLPSASSFSYSTVPRRRDDSTFFTETTFETIYPFATCLPIPLRYQCYY